MPANENNKYVAIAAAAALLLTLVFLPTLFDEPEPTPEAEPAPVAEEPTPEPSKQTVRLAEEVIAPIRDDIRLYKEYSIEYRNDPVGFPHNPRLMKGWKEVCLRLGYPDGHEPEGLRPVVISPEKPLVEDETSVNSPPENVAPDLASHESQLKMLRDCEENYIGLFWAEEYYAYEKCLLWHAYTALGETKAARTSLDDCLR